MTEAGQVLRQAVERHAASIRAARETAATIERERLSDVRPPAPGQPPEPPPAGAAGQP